MLSFVFRIDLSFENEKKVFKLLLFAFESVIIGGMGSFKGTLIGALLLGVTQQMGFLFDPGWGIWFGHIVFLLLLLVRPQGLFPKTVG